MELQRSFWLCAINEKEVMKNDSQPSSVAVQVMSPPRLAGLFCDARHLTDCRQSSINCRRTRLSLFLERCKPSLNHALLISIQK